MSDILIKGMEMPTSCWRCTLSQLYEKPREMLVCKITHEEVLRHKIDSNCPLVPVPPHGRLIDADALRCLYDPHDYGLDGEQADEYDRYHVSLPVIRQNIDDMPTIIEAEEGE